MSVLIAGVGYHNLRDLSLGPLLVPTLRAMDWPPHVEIDDWSFGPIAVVQRLEELPGHYERIIFVSATERGREQGKVYAYAWQDPQPSNDEIQQRVGEAVMGVISLDNLLIILKHFKVLPSDVYVVEVEPVELEFGMELSPRVEALRADVLSAVRELALGNGAPKAHKEQPLD